MIIGFTGPQGAGKTTAADHLMTHGFTRLNIKDGLHRELEKKMPDVLNQILLDYDIPDYQTLYSKKPKIFRRLMQNYGTEVRRGDDPRYWIKMLEKSMVESSASHFALDDIRFFNEADFVKLNEGVIVYIAGEPDNDGHSSELERQEIEPDFTIDVPKGDVIGLCKAVDDVVATIKENVD